MPNDATAAALDRPRDEAGRFTTTASAEAEEEVAEESAEAAAEVETTEAGTEAAEAASPTGVSTAPSTEAAPSEATAEDLPTAEEPPAAAESTEPFHFRADGHDIVVDGATLTGDSITIPREAWNRDVQPYLADRRGWERERSRLQTQVRQLDPERNESVIRASHLLAKLETIATELERGNEAPLVDLVNNFTTHFRVWKTEAENEALKRSVKFREEQSSAESRQQEAAELDPLLRSGLRSHVDAVLATETFRGLGFRTDEIAGELWELFERGAPVFVDLRDPAAAAQRGVSPDVYVDVAFVQRYLDRPAKLIRDREAKLKAKTEAAKKNAAVLAPKKTPAVVPGAGSPEVGGKGRPELKTKDDYEAYLRRTYGPV
jgi:hypothetical protein